MDWHNKPSIKRVFFWSLKLAALGFLAVGVVCLLLVAGMIYKAGPWTHIIYAEKPIPHFFGGIGALFMLYLLFHGIHNTSSDWRRFGAKALLFTMSLTFSLVAGEMGLRIYYSALQNANSMEKFKTSRREGKSMRVRSTHPLSAIIQLSEDLKVVYELRPHLDREWGNKGLKTNSDGMREDNDYPVQRIPESIRIIGIGDSGMFGWNLEQNEDYMAVMETNLNQRQDGTAYEVLNLAVPGYNTQLEVELLRSKGLKYKPDIVIVGWCANDWSLPFFLLEKENYRRRDVSFLYNLLFRRFSSKDNATDVAPGFTLRDQRDFDKAQVMPELTTGTEVAGVRKALIELKNLSEQAGFKVLVFGPMRKVIRDICAEVGIPYSNTRDLIPKGTYPPEYLVYFMHPNKDGHCVLAEHLEKDLVKRGWLPPHD